jgi:hypothetical protein
MVGLTTSIAPAGTHGKQAWRNRHGETGMAKQEARHTVQSDPPQSLDKGAFKIYLFLIEIYRKL